MSRRYRIAKRVLFALDPERAHRLSIRALKARVFLRPKLPLDARLHVEAAGVSFPNPLGLAAGYDKNAEVPDALLRLGFGFVEVGTVTPQPQDGNPRPRIFRLQESHAIINRLGFNNDGQADVCERLKKRVRKAGIVGVNVGANKDAPDRIRDYLTGIHAFESLASYLTVNISSPNTPGLRDLQKGEELPRLLGAIMAARDGMSAVNATPPCPIFVKVAPDLSSDEILAIARAAKEHKVDGLIVANTTLSRQGVEGQKFSDEAGGLSGRPLNLRSNYVLASFRKALGPQMPLIGVGGVESARTAIAKIEAGADLVQFYTALVYGGPELPVRILGGMIRFLNKAGHASIRDVRDTKVEEILERGAPADWYEPAS